MSRDDGCHKIGRSASPSDRSTQLKAHLVWTIRTGDMVWLESYLHRAFAEYRKDGEWFDLPDWVVNELVAVDLIHDETHITDWLKDRHTANPTAKRRVLYMQLPPELDDALVRFITAQRIKPDRTAVGLTALEELLTKEGFWPPPPAKK